MGRWAREQPVHLVGHSVDLEDGLIGAIPQTFHWKYLSHLSLRYIITTQRALEGILLRHTDTLRSLKLANIRFLRDTLDGTMLPGSFIGLFQFLNTSLFLTSISLSSILSNGVNEAFRVHNKKKENNDKCASGCLLKNIEKFGTHNGPFPFSL